MLKIVLLNPPSKQKYLRDQYCTSVAKANYYWHPIDLVIQSGILSQKHEVIYLDAQVGNMTFGQCIKKIIDLNPDVIIFITGFLSRAQDLNFIKKLTTLIKCTVIASGGYILYNCKEFLNEHRFVDAILLDYSSDALLGYFDGRKDLYDLCVREGDRIIEYSRLDSKNFSIPIPKYELIPLNDYRYPYLRSHKFASVITSYGCPYQCDFCIARKIPFKQRNLDSVIAELEALNLLGIKELFFRDFSFGVDKKYTFELCQYLKSKSFSWSASSRVDVLDQDILNIMKESGCHSLNFGIEYPGDKQLKEINKNITVEQINNTFSYCQKIGIKTLAHYIIGLPDNSIDDINKLIKFSVLLPSSYASYKIAIPLPGTKISCGEGTPLEHHVLKKMEKKAYRAFYFNYRYISNYIKNLSGINDYMWAIKNCIKLFNRGNYDS